LLLKPEILVLDEVSANLDEETEMRIAECLLSLKGEMTILAVSHRKALIKFADQILELKNGSAFLCGNSSISESIKDTEI
jgi:ABC-type transport system involved in cytochrome bd biosynthesis fused ATPase/permease subunit